VNFTREPIIETIITPKDGFKLVVRNSKVANLEEYCVDAVEVISFGNAVFYRSLEKPKSFLLPTSDFEVVEVRETKVNLKSVNIEKTIKIAGGRENSQKAPEQSQRPSQEAKEDSSSEGKRKKRSRKKRGQDKKEENRDLASPQPKATLPAAEGAPHSHVKTLIPPPSTLISETISRYKPTSAPAEAHIIEAEIAGQDETDLMEKVPFSQNDFDAIWMQETPSFEEVSYFDNVESARESVKLAKSIDSDEPIGKTHIEEALHDDED
jgi:hypothetical protein